MKCPFSVCNSRAFCCEGTALTSLEACPLAAFVLSIIWPSWGVDMDEIRKLPLPVVLEPEEGSEMSPNGPPFAPLLPERY